MFYSLGRLNLSILSVYRDKLVTDETTVTDERLMHIKQKHPQDIELFGQYGKLCVEDPDMVIRDMEHDGAVFMVKRLPETNLNVVVRLVLQGENEEHKNSVMTFYRIREKNLKKLINKNNLLYTK